MRHSKTTKAMALMLSLVMITSVFVGNTLSRYVTSVSSTDSARVAVWGINGGEVTMELFNTQYDLDGKLIAKSNVDDEKIIAPGTGGSSAFSIINYESDTIPPEVAYTVKIDLDDSEVDPKIINNTSIQWKLDNNAWGTFDEMISSVLLLSGDASGVYEFAPGTFADTFKSNIEHVISWQWIMDGNNEVDTQMGNDALTSDIGVKITVSITAEQSDGSSVNMLDGANQVVNIDDIQPAVFRSAAPKDDLQEVRVNDEVVDPSNYDVTEGSTIITFKKEFLKTLGEGTYTIDIVSKNMTATAKFYVTTAPIVHNGIIPEGGVYYQGIEGEYIDWLDMQAYYVGNYDGATVYKAGDEFPELQAGDVYVYGDYEYRYDMSFNDMEDFYEDYSTDTWSVQTLDDKALYGNILSSINGKDVTSLDYTFYYNNSIIKSPKIPKTIVSMIGTFKDSSLEEAPVIPENVEKLWEAFYYCYNLTGTIEINSKFLNIDSLQDFLYETQITWITGLISDEMKQKIATDSEITLIDPNDASIIPVGGTYYSGHDGYEYPYPGDVDQYSVVLNAGDKFPEPQIGDAYVYGDYEYRYGFSLEQAGHWYFENRDYAGGWSVAYVNMSNKKPGKILSNIAGKNIVDMRFAFASCSIVEAPVIPDSVTNMWGTFSGCTSLVNAPVIPDSVIYMDSTFYDCRSLVNAPVIPNSVTDMDYTFFNCTSLTGTIEINANPTYYEYAFSDTEKAITLTGSSDLLFKIATTSDNGNVLVDIALSENVIQFGGTYYVGVYDQYDYENSATEILQYGDKFPEPQTGDVYVYGDYEYRYNMYYETYYGNMTWCEQEELDGWGVIATKNKTKYEAFLTNIGEKEVKDMSGTYYDLSDLVSVEININPGDYNYFDALHGTKVVEITGTTTMKDEILLTSTGIPQGAIYYKGVGETAPGNYDGYTDKYEYGDMSPIGEMYCDLDSGSLNYYYGRDIFVYDGWEYRFAMKYDESQNKWVDNDIGEYSGSPEAVWGAYKIDENAGSILKEIPGMGRWGIDIVEY